jgi:hypothetical protein
MKEISSEDHHGSHRDLLWTPDDPSADGVQVEAGGARVDAIIVPTVRHPRFLMDAAATAASMDCPLVTLHSTKWTSAREAARLLPAHVSLIAIDMPGRADLRLPESDSARLLTGTRFDRKKDTSTKRNLALMLCHMVGWERIVFLDDDIRIRDPDQLTHASGLLDIYNAVGLTIGGYPDNSVVCHAYRIVGGKQESFVGGGALVVGTARSRSFFPDIYNEDWFYLLDAKKGLQPLASSGEAIQRPYDPFRTPDRARAEELGDVLAEGTFWLLDQGCSVADADEAHWAAFLKRRSRFIVHVLGMVERSVIESAEKARMVAALKAALGRLACITPSLCLDYMRAWTADWYRWQDHFDGLGTDVPLDSALNSLTRQNRPSLAWRARILQKCVSVR